MLPKAGLFSPGVGGLIEFPKPKLPKLPIAALPGAALQGELGPLPRILPAVLLRLSVPKGELVFGSSARSSPSLTSVSFREKNGDGSSLEKRPVPAGDPSPVIESLVCWRRVLGRLDDGEASPKAFEPCERDVLRPFVLCPFESLFRF